MRFVDLFCGIGGFHAALHRLGHECVFATDIDVHAAKVYEKNWGKPGNHPVHSDVREVFDEIPAMDIICAGFPCQPFSKSGAQKGFKDQTRGTLFHDICSLAEKHTPAVLFLENVPNLVSHDKGNTMRVIKSRLDEIGYSVWSEILSPHDYGTCQVRKRVYIVCIRKDLEKSTSFNFPKDRKVKLDIRNILDKRVKKKFRMNDEELNWLNMWEEFLKNVNKETKLPGHPIWADCFQGKEKLPGELNNYNKKELLQIAETWKEYGWVKPVELTMSKNELIKAINLPMWKQNFISKNRYLYDNNEAFISNWLKKWKVLETDETGKPIIPVSRRKYEWQAGPDSRTNWENIFQFRPSGIRVKRGNYFPALVAMAQIPVVGWLKRHITPKECARIQDFDVDGNYGKPFVLGDSDQQSYKQLGNAVNVNLIYLIQKNIDTYLGWRNEMEMEMISKVATKISRWNWKLFFSQCEKLGGQLDGLDWRVVKGVWTNEALRRCSNKKFKPKENQKGFDGLLDFSKLEIKGEKKGLFQVRNPTTKSIQLKNVHNKEKKEMLIDDKFPKTFDYLLLFQTTPPYKVAITSWHFANKHKKIDTAGQVNTKIPYDDLVFIDIDSEGLEEGSKQISKQGIKPLLGELKNVISNWFED